jgi:hypothetical protein
MIRWRDTKYHYVPTDLADVLRQVHGDPGATLSLRLDQLDSLETRVIGDTWCGLLDGRWLVARRPSTFDTFVQAGVKIIVRGSLDYRRAFAVATAELVPELAGALDRRIRFVASTKVEPDDAHTGLTLSLYDSGPYTFR